MRLFYDVNVLLDEYFEREGAAASEAAIRAAGIEGNDGWIAGHTLAQLFYIVRKRTSKADAWQYLRDLLEWVQIAPIANVEAINALDYGMTDFEDALQLSAAVACGADVIITRNTSDFTKNLLPVLTPEEFLAR
ncbi:MAG: hypothetical protein RL693_2660 [Verrucomicrobiota bacterium]|jgi:predicted nucleic acid-binding protein